VAGLQYLRKWHQAFAGAAPPVDEDDGSSRALPEVMNSPFRSVRCMPLLYQFAPSLIPGF
jgi:hypothetical protein